MDSVVEIGNAPPASGIPRRDRPAHESDTETGLYYYRARYYDPPT